MHEKSEGTSISSDQQTTQSNPSDQQTTQSNPADQQATLLNPPDEQATQSNPPDEQATQSNRSDDTNVNQEHPVMPEKVLTESPPPYNANIQSPLEPKPDDKNLDQRK